jgi:hypothetical protein
LLRVFVNIYNLIKKTFLKKPKKAARRDVRSSSGDIRRGFENGDAKASVEKGHDPPNKRARQGVFEENA